MRAPPGRRLAGDRAKHEAEVLERGAAHVVSDLRERRLGVKQQALGMTDARLEELGTKRGTGAMKIAL
jgi:hypothetical protein